VTYPPPPAPTDLLLLLFILFLGASLRLLWIHAPLLDAHRWRQVDTASITRSLYEDRFNLFYPQVNWGGRDGYVESEFPLLPAITAALYELFGPQDFLGRVVSMVFSTAMIAATFGLAGELLGASGGLAAAFLVAVSPAAVFFGRTFMPDSSMLFFWIAGVFGFVRYFRTDSRRALWLGSIATALACLVKLPALMMMAPIVGAAWHARGPAAIRDRRFLVALIVPLFLTAAWYLHAFLLYRQTGLTFGILVHPARTYPLTVAPGPWPYAFSKWSTLKVLASSDYYLTLLARIHQLLLLPWGFAGALLGAVVWRRADRRLVADLWLAAMVAFVLIMAEANIGHEYYQLPLVPLGAMYFGAFIGPAFEAGWRPARGLGLARPAAFAIVLAIIGGVGFFYSGIINSHFRPNNLDVRALQAGQAIERVVPGDALLVVADDYGSTSPLLLYFAHRKGWSFDLENLFPQVIEGLKAQQGARFFVTTVWSRIEHERPDTAAYLRFYQRLALHGEPADTAVFDLGRRTE
jgi:4-amino-4-deoxy-L-arabinose transferase-like glycosyltransferase